MDMIHKQSSKYMMLHAGLPIVRGVGKGQSISSCLTDLIPSYLNRQAIALWHTCLSQASLKTKRYDSPAMASKGTGPSNDGCSLLLF